MAETSDADLMLVKKVQQGHKSAFDLLVLKYQQRLAQAVSRLIVDHDEVRDVVQDSFVKAYRSIQGFRGDSAFYTWLYRIATNTAKNYLAARKRQPPREGILLDQAQPYYEHEAVQYNASPERQWNKGRLEKAVYVAIQKLPYELKTALTLREFDGLSYEAIAQVMDTPIGTVRSRIFRAREAIEHRITDYT